MLRTIFTLKDTSDRTGKRGSERDTGKPVLAQPGQKSNPYKA